MIDLELSWRQAAGAAAGLAALTVALRAARKPQLTSVATFTRESALVLGLFALWQLAGSFAVMGPDGALSRSRWIWQFERTSGCPARPRSSMSSCRTRCSSSSSISTTTRCTSRC